MAQDRMPYNPEFCKAIKCEHRHGNKCVVDACIYNHKRIRYWEVYGKMLNGESKKVDKGGKQCN